MEKKIVCMHSQMTGFLINDKQNAFYARCVCVCSMCFNGMKSHSAESRHPIPSHECFVCVCVCELVCLVNSIIIANYFQLIFAVRCSKRERERE